MSDEVNSGLLLSAPVAAVASSGIATESVGKRRGQPLVREGEASASSAAAPQPQHEPRERSLVTINLYETNNAECSGKRRIVSDSLCGVLKFKQVQIVLF